MAAIMLCYPNRIDEAMLSGGAWSATLPLSNAQDPLLALRTRSANATPAATLILIDLQRLRLTRVAALIDHNLSATARYRLTGSTSSDFSAPVLDTGWHSVWSVIWPFGSVPWEDEHFWTGLPTADDLGGYRRDLIVPLQASVLARYWRLEIDDASNPAGFVEFGRAFISDGWRPAKTLSYGSSIGFQARTDVAEAISGAETFDVRPPRRVQQLSLDWLSSSEAMGKALELQRQVGIHGEVLYLHDENDRINMHRRSFLGRLRTLSPIEHPYYDTHRVAVEIQEVL